MMLLSKGFPSAATSAAMAMFFATAVSAAEPPKLTTGSDLNINTNPLVQPQDPALSGGGRDQSQLGGDTLRGGPADNLLVGRAGPDILIGSGGSDILVGGIEHFGPNNRDRAFGNANNDIFIWKPGDGSDIFDGGGGHDVLIFGVTGEVGAGGGVEFAVVNDGLAGNLFVDPVTGLPQVNVSGSPGFCTVVDASSTPTAAADLAALGLEKLVRFSLRGIADAFEAGAQSEDNGLRVTIGVVDVEFVICTDRLGGVIEILDLRHTPPRKLSSTGPIGDVALRQRLAQIVF